MTCVGNDQRQLAGGYVIGLRDLASKSALGKSPASECCAVLDCPPQGGTGMLCRAHNLSKPRPDKPSSVASVNGIDHARSYNCSRVREKPAIVAVSSCQTA